MRRLLVPLAVLAGLLAPGCLTRRQLYRPIPVVAAAGDPRPDLPGVPVGPDHALFNAEVFLRVIAPPGRPVVVRSSPLTNPYLGLTHPDHLLVLKAACAGTMGPPVTMGGGPVPLVIEIRDDLEDWQQRETLIHEWAHVLSWGLNESPHGAVWGAYFSYLYRLTRKESP